MRESGFLLGDPWNLLLLVPVLLGSAYLFLRGKQGVGGGSLHWLGGLPATWRTRTTWLPGSLLCLAMVFLVVALARPLKGREESRIWSEGIDILLCVDVSSSMLEPGLEQGMTNLEVVKEVVADFVSGRSDDRIGLVTFAGYARMVCPLTLDQDAVLEHLSEVECVRPNSEEDGTAIGLALGQAARKLKDSDAASRVIILLTDGEENRRVIDPREAAALCKDLGIRVYTVGAGRQYMNTFGGRVEVGLDTQLLEEVAQKTEGKFWRAKDTSMLAGVYDEIGRLETAAREELIYTDHEDLYHGLVLASLFLLITEFGLRRGPYLEVTS